MQLTIKIVESNKKFNQFPRVNGEHYLIAEAVGVVVVAAQSKVSAIRLSKHTQPKKAIGLPLWEAGTTVSLSFAHIHGHRQRKPSVKMSKAQQPELKKVRFI